MSNQVDDKNKNRPEQENLEDVMKKVDRESNVRVWTGKPAVAVKILLIGFSLFCIWVTLFATFLEEIRLTSFMGLIVLLGFLYYPADKNNNRENHMPWYDILGMICGAGAFLYYT
ncbi:MAG: TRAP transporter permease, partial [Lachnospiraceae bacterium]|nr:TRAP transporter permease [Lachnospiraceae bacterium]